MFATEDTNQIENDDFMAGFTGTDDSDTEEVTEETTAPAEEEAEDTNEVEADAEGDKTEQTEGSREKTADVEMFPRTVKFLGEEKQISMEEAVTAIQKGLNYDRMLEKYRGQVAGFENDVRVQFVEKLAKAAGMSAEEYITIQENQGEYQALIEEYGDISSVPAAVMEKFNKYSQAAVSKAKADSEAAAQRAYREEKAAEYLNFIENHPEFSGEVPQAVMDMVAKGESLEGAYAIHQLKEVTAQLAQTKKDFEIYKTNTANQKSKSPDVRSSKKADDDFLAGFMDE